ncbi:hypothetical protein [Nocardia paucivorans]|uniref:hypothetical protein n=1 Tax=Nocardia paucivorans TaxID=114259 RepID=UPI000687C3B4|nr:hypothetical protein [Nocardia paucivorans]
MTTTCSRGPMLHPRLMILTRPSGAVQLGWDPETALLLEAPGLRPDQVVAFLRLLDGLNTRAQIVWRAGEQGLTPDQALALIDAIDAEGLLLHPEQPAGRIRSVRVHGLGPLSDAIAAGLRGLGVRPERSRGGDCRVSSWTSDLVILADALIPDPLLVHRLTRGRIAHLPVRLRDGKGVVGPLVLPGRTACLRCADLVRRDLDDEWPMLAAQLLGRVGYAGPAGIAATAALALGELEIILACSPRREPATLSGTLELDLDSYCLAHRRWAPHADCGCLSPDPDNGRDGYHN